MHAPAPSRSNRSRTALRFALVCVSASLGLGLALALWPAEPPTEIRYAERSEQELDLVEQRSRGAEPRPSAATGRRLHREPLPPDVIPVLLPVGENNERGNIYDPLCYFRYKPHYERRTQFPLHPDGGWWLRTNSRGLKGSREVLETRPNLRILVAGDSHVDGFCADEETFARRLEDLLSTHAQGPVESLNAGHAGYAFYQYVGSLELHMELRPHVFVLAVYTGNDFVESLVLRNYYDGQLDRELLTEPSRFRALYPALSFGFIGQYLRQVLHFREHPANEQRAIETAVTACIEMADICRERGILFLPMIMPPAPEVQPAHIDVDLAAVARQLNLAPRDIFSVSRLTQQWTAALAAEGIEVLDPRPHLKAAPEPLYWPEDYHLSVAGNAAIATWLAAEIEKRWRPELPRR